MKQNIPIPVLIVVVLVVIAAVFGVYTIKGKNTADKPNSEILKMMQQRPNMKAGGPGMKGMPGSGTPAIPAPPAPAGQ
jgi:hypothetical protein